MQILAGGRLATTAAILFAGAKSVTLVLNNTGTGDETIILTILRDGQATAQRLGRVVLEANEQAHILNIPIANGDVLRGYTTSVSTVDYLVLESAGGTFGIVLLESVGTGKGVSALRKMQYGMEQFVGGDLPDLGAK